MFVGLQATKGQELLDLNEARQKGLSTEKEYEKQKKKIYNLTKNQKKALLSKNPYNKIPFKT